MPNSMNRMEILEMVKNGQISEEDGLGLIKALFGIDDGDDLIYYAPQWVPAPPETVAPGQLAGSTVICFTRDTPAEAAKLKQTLSAEFGCTLLFICPGEYYRKLEEGLFAINGQDFGNYLQMCNTLKEEGVVCRQIVHFFSTDSFPAKGELLQEQLHNGIFSLLYLTQALIQAKLRENVNLVYGFLGEGQNVEPQYAGVSGFLRTVSLELPRYSCKTVQVDSRDSLTALRLLLGELGSFRGGDFEVRHTRGQRLVRQFKILAPPAQQAGAGLPFKSGGTYLITGGTGGLGLIFADHLAQKGPCTLVLCGRSELNKEKRQRMGELTARGARVKYVQADIGDYASTLELVAGIKQDFGALDGLLHCAGNTRDGFVMNKKHAEMEAVLQPKVEGTINLDLATREEKLDFFILFSSITGALGNSGQSDYAFANGFMDSFAAHRTQLVEAGVRWGQTVSLNWPLWKSGGMLVNETVEGLLKLHFGMVPLNNNGGLEAFETMLASGQVQIGVIEGDRERFRACLEQVREAKPAAPTTGTTGTTAAVTRTDSKPPAKTALNPPAAGQSLQEYTEGVLVAICADLLRVKAGDIDKDTELLEYGVDSIMMMSFLNRMEKEFDEAVSPNAIAEGNTIRLLARFLINDGVIKESALSRNEGGEAEVSAEQPVQVLKSRRSTAPLRALTRPAAGNAAPARQNGQSGQKIAVISMACRLPQSPSPEAFWEHLKAKEGLIRSTEEVRPKRWDVDKFYSEKKSAPNASYSKWAGYVDDIDAFDAGFFGIKDEEAVSLDPQHRILLELTQELFDRANLTREKWNNSATSVYLGGNEGSYVYHYWNKIEDKHLKRIVVNRIQNMMAARISDFYNLRGVSLVIDTACSSSLVALHEACRNIMAGESQMAIVGGVELIIGEYHHVGFSKSGALSDSPRSYVFDQRAGGFVLGEGAGLVLLKDYEQALADKDDILGVILGSAVNNDGHTMGLTVPNMEGQKEVITKAVRAAGISPDTITYLEAHGTGTLLGDPIEVKAASTVYRNFTQAKQYCAIGSVKAHIGHLLRAAGIAGVIKILRSLKHKQLPPSLNCDTPHPRFKFAETPFRPITELEDWAPRAGVRRAAISSFGFGGTNAHVIFEEHPGGKEGYDKQYKSPFKRKRYWLDKWQEAASSVHIAPVPAAPARVVLDDETYVQLLEKLSRGEITPDELLELEEQ